MSVKMRVLSVLGLWLGVCEAILAGGRSADNTSAVHNNRATADQVVPQESSQRSAYYTDFYPDEQGYHFEAPQHHVYPPHAHYGHHSGLHALLLPLAGVALLGAAAVFASNPILLQLGVVSGRRRRRELRREGLSGEKLRDLLALEEFVSQVSRDELAKEERRLLATYLTCSGVQHSTCLQRLTCEVFQPGASVSAAERHVMDIIIYEVIKNEFIDEEMKMKIIKARKSGHFGEHCGHFPCQKLDQQTKIENKEEENI